MKIDKMELNHKLLKELQQHIALGHLSDAYGIIAKIQQNGRLAALKEVLGKMMKIPAKDNSCVDCWDILIEWLEAKIQELRK